jgi:protein TonB
VATVKEPPKEPPPEVPPPAPGPPDDDAPAAQRVYVMPGGGMVVNPGSATGTATGRPGGHRQGDRRWRPSGIHRKRKGGAAGLGVAHAEALGDYDLSKDYPAEAKRNGIQGEVAVRLLVGADGRVTETKLARGLSGGLNEKAIELGRRIRFKPALDDSGAP